MMRARAWTTLTTINDGRPRRPCVRLVTPNGIARAFLFVVSDDAAMVTGSALTVDGGPGL
jgi:NAD(P)-dependent dehydrogenase (short-subunit alcohol dehydrogenase family)